MGGGQGYIFLKEETWKKVLNERCLACAGIICSLTQVPMMFTECRLQSQGAKTAEIIFLNPRGCCAGVDVKEKQIQAGVLLGIAPHHTPQILFCTPNLFFLSSIC